jgi:hypothetical protein
MVKLELAGAHTHLVSPLCSRCPHGRAGCCAAPPAVAWADIGRIVALGGRDWLLEQIRAENLRPMARGLAMRRAPAGVVGGEVYPERCGYLGPSGCTIAPDRRSATCNYYLCDEGFAEGQGSPDRARARDAHERLVALYGRWDLEIKAAIDERFPEGVSWNAAFLDWMGEAWKKREREAKRALGALRPR